MAKHWTEGIVGIWILVSPWLLGFSHISLAKWNAVIAGLILVVVNAWELFAEPKPEIKGQPHIH